jgi:hypothetical protein
MPTQNALVQPPAAATAPARRGSDRPARSWLTGWRPLAIAGLLIALIVALAVGQGWIAAATLLPLLYTLPCAAMMLVCMKGMNQGQQQPSPGQAQQHGSDPTSGSGG